MLKQITIPENFQADIIAINSIEAVPTILDVVCRTTGMGFAAVARVTEGRWIACNVRDDINFGLKPGGELKVETTICHEIRQNRAPVIINHVAEDPAFANHHTPAMYGFQSYISMPIILSDGSFFGTLCAIDPRPNQLDKPETISMFKLFAQLIAFHLNALEKVSESEERFLEERKASQLREQFIAVLSHDLRNPLGAISSGSILLQRMPLEDRAKSIANMMQDCVVRMTELIENVLDFARGRLGSGVTLLKVEDAPLEATIRHVIEEMRVSWPKNSIEAEYHFTQPVDADASRVAQVVSNLLGNALKYGDANQPVRIYASAKAGVFELSVFNGGKPIPAAARERLFNPFARGEVQSDQQGLGLGLYIASEIARAHNGTMSVTSNEQETCFTFRMPCENVQAIAKQA